jgi:hypothetical protein
VANIDVQDQLRLLVLNNYVGHRTSIVATG